MVNSLYIHIPFCIKKCAYCDFYSIPFKRDTADEYAEALLKEMLLRKNVAGILKTVYIGGGTPTMLSVDSIDRLLHEAGDIFVINPGAEITIETNPRTITKEKAQALLKAGINRISIGAQSFNDKELAALGRSHSAADAICAAHDAREAGFTNISLDLIYGIPFYKSQIPSLESRIQKWEYSLQKALELNPEHISAYELTPEKNTPLYNDIREGRVVMPDEELISEMYYRCIETLTDNGYVHYEISNFAKPGYECRHNLNYWDRGEYLGIGAGAHSFFYGKRSCNIRDASGYAKSLASNELPVEEETEISADEAIKEFIFLGLRKTGGIDMGRLPEQKKALIKKAVEELSSYGLVEFHDNRLRLSRKGLILSSEVIVRVLSGIEKRLPS